MPTLAALVAAYRIGDKPEYDLYLDFYRSLPSLEHAVENAALARGADGRKHPHQYRVSNHTLAQVRDALM